MAKYRQERVAHELLKTIAEALQYETRDARLHELTLTQVKMSSDLQLAHLRWLAPEGTDRKATEESLKRVTPFLRAIVGERMYLRRIPQLIFHYDSAYEEGLKMTALLERLRKEGQMGEGPAAAPVEQEFED